MINYAKFVESRCKPGAEIVGELTERKAHLLHMAVGVAGESLEIFKAVCKMDEKNVLEEAGDVIFFVQGILNTLKAPSTNVMLGQDEGVLEIGEAILDAVKKHVIYNKELDEEALAINCFKINRLVNEIANELDVTFEELQKRNIEKLSLRYPTGYSDQAAQARADKKEGEE